MLEVQYDILVEAMSNARNLKAAEAAHEAFLAACITQNFLDVSIFTTVLTRFLSHCKSFCASLKVNAQRMRKPEGGVAMCDCCVYQWRIGPILLEVLHERFSKPCMGAANWHLELHEHNWHCFHLHRQIIGSFNVFSIK